MPIINVKEFCKKTGFPLAMLRAYCREGKLSHWKRGRVYLIDEDDAFGELKNLKETTIHRRSINQKRVIEHRKAVSGDFNYRAEIFKMQERCKADASLDNKE